MDRWVFDWNEAEGGDGAGAPTQPVEVDDETLRDGLQSPSAKAPPLQAKLEFLRILVDLGIQAVDIGLPATGGHAKEDALFIASEIARSRLPLKPNCAARTLVSDVRHVVEISQKAGIAVEVATFIGSSMARQCAEDWSLAFLLKVTRDSVSAAVKEGLPVMYVTEDTTRARPEVLRQLYSAAIDCGATRACLADTVGFVTPSGARRLVAFIKEVIAATGAEVGIDWHGHMDRGLGLASSLAALEAGADRIHGSALGIGERVGNTPLDLLLVNLKLMGRWPRDVRRLPDYVEWVARYAGVTIPWNYPVFGRDAYRTGTGIHASAIVKAMDKGDAELADVVYSSVPSSWFGREQTIEVSPMSGDSNVLAWLGQHGVEPAPEKVRAVKRLAKEADHTLSDDEIWDVLRRLENP